MPEEIVIKRSWLIGILLLLVLFAAYVLFQQVPDIKRELRIWTM